MALASTEVSALPADPLVFKVHPGRTEKGETHAAIKNNSKQAQKKPSEVQRANSLQMAERLCTDTTPRLQGEEAVPQIKSTCISPAG